MSRTLFSLAGFQVITIGRFWVIAEAPPAPTPDYKRNGDISTIDQRFHGFRVADNSGVDGDKPVSLQ
jgi:hypothetical protein